ncbi:hypothetical protein QQY66_22255 [Streptomyces sp. DG2A-72]|uniref:hypothetical protein n=1 Tax=Streptomyces sp. DG2A-72 TaxID=3051386 RepID=UPI00265BFECA|nr:hypothetical protein [Streptomyces sp. DG2A-72]MDO0934277.1 hypothetical protein [Streptomyces sp. DG2A-72]
MTDPMPTPGPGPAGESRSSWQDLPLDQQAASWEAAVPGSAERMLRQIEADYEHRRWMDRVEVRFRIFGAVLAGTGITGVFWLTKYLVDHDAPGFAAGVFGASIAAFAGLVLRRDRPGP